MPPLSILERQMELWSGLNYSGATPALLQVHQTPAPRPLLAPLAVPRVHRIRRVSKPQTRIKVHWPRWSLRQEEALLRTAGVELGVQFRVSAHPCSPTHRPCPRQNWLCYRHKEVVSDIP